MALEPGMEMDFLPFDYMTHIVFCPVTHRLINLKADMHWLEVFTLHGSIVEAPLAAITAAFLCLDTDSQ